MIVYPSLQSACIIKKILHSRGQIARALPLEVLILTLKTFFHAIRMILPSINVKNT